MGPLLVVVFVAVAAALWVSSVRRRRDAWLDALSLPGTWTLENAAQEGTLELAGNADAGAYVETTGAVSEEGTWRVVGQTVVFTSAAGESVCELRQFDDGQIGLDGPGRERRIYRRQQSNVVPLRGLR